MTETREQTVQRLKDMADSRRYKDLAKQVIRSIEVRYGKSWQSCFVPEVQRALLAREAFFVMQGAARNEDQTGQGLADHGRALYSAALDVAGVNDE